MVDSNSFSAAGALQVKRQPVASAAGDAGRASPAAEAVAGVAWTLGGPCGIKEITFGPTGALAAA